VPAAVASLPLLVGAIAGLIAADRSAAGVAQLAAAGALLSLISATAAAGLEARAESLCAIVTGCGLAGASLAASSAGGVYAPPLLRWFEARGGSAATPVVIDGTLREDAAWSPAGAWVIVDVRQISSVAVTGRGSWRQETSGGARITIAGMVAPWRLAAWRAGRRVRMPAFLRLPATYIDPGVRDDRRALARRGVVLVGTAKSALLVEVEQRGGIVAELASSARAWVRAQLGAAVGRWSPRSAAIATAVLIGDRTGLPDADTRRLQDAGTYHVIAISGGNIAILTVLLLWLLAYAGVGGRPAAIVTIAALLAYREVVIAAPSVERAISAAVLYLAARVIDHRSAPLNVVAVAGGLAIARSPIVLLDPGFLLSFSATIGILVAGHVWSRGPREPAVSGRAVRDLRAAVCTTLAAEAALLPIAAVLFGRVTIAGLALNLIAVPLMSALQAASLAALALAPLPLAASGAGYVAHVAAIGILESARVTDVVPVLAHDVTAPSPWLVAAYYSGLTCAVLAATRRTVRAAILFTLATAALIVAGPRWTVQGVSPASPHLRVVVLDVGQGDATAVLLPDGRAILVDAGGVAAALPPEPDESGAGGFDVGQRVVLPALRALGVRRLDTLAVTHGDPDHIGGAPAVMRSMNPAAIWDGVPVPPHPALRALNDLAVALHVPWRTVQAGDVERVSGVRIRVLHPPLPDWERQRVRNDDSVVLDIRAGDVSIVLPGDVGSEGENAILPLLEPARLVILKAAHHGSATSSTPALLDALRPAAVIFSAGRDNRFGHPAPQVVARYHERGAAMFSTAESGAIFVDTDGTSVSVWGWAHPESVVRLRGK
jgi:competence protein ComEC